MYPLNRPSHDFNTHSQCILYPFPLPPSQPPLNTIMSRLLFQPPSIHPHNAKLHWYPLMRDSSYYLIVLVLLSIFFGVTTPNVIDWWEALVLQLMYWGYVAVMYHNDKIRVIMESIFVPARKSHLIPCMMMCCDAHTTHPLLNSLSFSIDTNSERPLITSHFL